MARRDGLPADFTISWSGVDDTTPPGCITVEGLDCLGNRTSVLMRGSDPETATVLGRVLHRDDGTVVYQRWNSFLAAGVDVTDGFARIHAATPGD